MGSFTAREVLDQLDDDARNEPAFFPDFDHGYYYHVDARLNVYADARRWAIVIEDLAVNPRAGTFAGACVGISYHGNCITPGKKAAGCTDTWYVVNNILANAPSGPILPDNAYSEEILLTAREILVRGKPVEIRTDENYYWGRNIPTIGVTHEQIDQWIAAAQQVENPVDRRKMIKQYEKMRGRAGKYELSTWNFLRGLVPEHRELLLATEVERRVGLPADLPLLRQVDNWDHPKLIEDELPSNCESFRQIAQVLAKCDPKLWTFDEASGNIHWRNWPESGSL